MAGPVVARAVERDGAEAGLEELEVLDFLGFMEGFSLGRVLMYRFDSSVVLRGPFRSALSRASSPITAQRRSCV